MKLSSQPITLQQQCNVCKQVKILKLMFTWGESEAVTMAWMGWFAYFQADRLIILNHRRSAIFMHNSLLNPVSSSSAGNHLVDEERSMTKVSRTDRNTPVTQIMTLYNGGKRKTISRHKTLRQMGYNSRWSHGISLLSAKNGNLRQQWIRAQTHLNQLIGKLHYNVVVYICSY